MLGQVALIKLNGGLATTMGLQQPKSLMEARDGLSFLDIIIGQTLALRRRYDVALPLVLMDSSRPASRPFRRWPPIPSSRTTAWRSTSCRA